MADISKIKTLDGTTYDIKDSVARLGQYYGVCDIPAGNAVKTVEIDGITKLATGLCINVKFTYANTVSNPTLNVNSLGAKNIRQYGTTNAAGAAATTGWQAGAVVQLTYDGSGWVRDQGYNTNTTYSGMSVAEYTAGTSTANRLISAANLKAAIELWGSDADTINGHTVNSDVPENAKFTDTTYSVATTSANGLMSSTDKSKLDSTLAFTFVKNV